MPDLTDMQPTPDVLRPLPEKIDGFVIPMAERRYTPYRQAFLSAFLRWLDETQMSESDVQDDVESVLSVIQQLHAIKKAAKAEVAQ